MFHFKHLLLRYRNVIGIISTLYEVNFDIISLFVSDFPKMTSKSVFFSMHFTYISHNKHDIQDVAIKI